MRKSITKARIVDAALDLLDEAGLDGLTVRALAERLGVRAPALYWHIRDKQALLDEMGTEIQRRVITALAELPADVEGAGWPGALGGYARVLRREYLAHRDGARTFSGTRLADPELLRAQEPWLARLSASGVSVAEVVLATELVTAFVVGFVIEEQERAQSEQERYSLDRRTEVVGADAPLVVAAGEVLFGDPDVRFEHHLATILTGIAPPS